MHMFRYPIFKSSNHPIIQSSICIALMMALCMGISACSYMPSWLGGGKKEAEKLPGERIAALPATAGLTPDDTLKDTPVTLPAPAANEDWPQHSGNVPAEAANLAASGNFSKITLSGRRRG